MHQRFPGNEDRRSFRIRRPLSRPSRHGLFDLADLKQEFPFDGVKALHTETDLTLVGKMDIVDARRAVPALGSMLFKNLARELLEPAPDSAMQSLLTKVHHVGYIGTRSVVRAALFLEDPDEILSHEYGVYTGRLDALGAHGRWKGMLPHISVGLVPKPYANNEILDWISDRTPSDIMLLPVNTDPRIPS